jgi:hypothetical protein
MIRCIHASSGCNGPVEAQCMGLCTHRVNTLHLPDDRAAVVLGRTEEPAPEISRVRLALNTYRLYRGVNCGRREALRNAWRALRRNT